MSSGVLASRIRQTLALGLIVGTFPPAQADELALDGANLNLDIAAVVVVGKRYQPEATTSATKTETPLRDIPQSITLMTDEQIRDQSHLSIGDVVRYIPGVTAHQGENNRDQIILRGNSSSADFFLNGVRDDVQYYRDIYNLERIEVLKGPNAMIFGRGGGGGVINRVTKEAGPAPWREVSLLGGSYENKRIAVDLNQPLDDRFALRLNGMYQDANSFRDFVDLERYAVNPTMTFSPGPDTQLTLGYEYLQDKRMADRGISSFEGRPADVDPSTFYGNPDDSHVRAYVNIATATIEHRSGELETRNRTMFGDYDRFYQNFVPGAVDPTQTLVALTSYNNATKRENIFSQTDLTYPATIGSMSHTLLGGFEFGHQETDNFRNTGFFNDTVTSIMVPYGNPTISTPVTFRQSATDADNHITAKVAAAYIQDQIQLSEHVQFLAGARFDRFELDYENNRDGARLDRTDDLFSPRLGLVIKPVESLSLYASYSVSYLPSSGDQFSSLTSITEGLKPEEFNNYEIGAKWDIGGLALTAAVYQLDRNHTRATDPNDPTRTVLTGSQRTTGFELGLAGNVTDRWQIAGGYAYQDARITSTTTAAPEGAQVGQVPYNSISLWNKYQFLPRFGAGLGVIYRSDMYANISDTVTLPGYTRVDAAAYYTINDRLSLQLNVENLFDKKYFINADSNTNITPGSPRIGLLTVSMNF
jgi:catecholate siderophore receptor